MFLNKSASKEQNTLTGSKMLMLFLNDKQKGSHRQKCRVKGQKVMLMLRQGRDSVVTAVSLKMRHVLLVAFEYFSFQQTGT